MTHPLHPLFPTWRWFGPDDPIPLAHIRQAGARGIVTALHDLSPGMPWPADRVAARKAEIEAAGLVWSVVESIPVSDEIKCRGPGWEAHVAAWVDSLQVVGAAGIGVVCYNFMPVIDWTRTQLDWRYPNGAAALRFDICDLAAWDIHGLGRAGAADGYAPEVAEAAGARWGALGADGQAAVEHAILSGLPGADRGYTREEFRAGLARYEGIGAEELRANLIAFLQEVVPVAEAAGVRLAIHPDDPPRPLFGLPRVVSCAADYAAMVQAVPARANGLTFCTGSLGARDDNDLPALARAHAARIHFAHLRNVRREGDGSFHESAHLDGSVPMLDVIAALMSEAARRHAGEEPDIPFRPDHGHIIGPDGTGRFNPGYTFAGRLRGLGELSGAMAGLAHA